MRKIEEDWPEYHFDKRANVTGYAFKRVFMFSKTSVKKRCSVGRSVILNCKGQTLHSKHYNFLEVDQLHGVSTS